MATTAIRPFLENALCITVDSGDGFILIAGGGAIGYKSVGPFEVRIERTMAIPPSMWHLPSQTKHADYNVGIFDDRDE